jgi:hypothetical protein
MIGSYDLTVAYSLAPLAHAALAQSPLLRCELCKKSFKSSETLLAHNDSAKHKKREAELHKLSPAKRSPSKASSLSVSEQKAQQMPAGPRAAQTFFDLGNQFAQLGDGDAASRCLRKCLAMLPPRSAVSVSRIMIEVRCRSLLARILWTVDAPQAFSQLDLALKLFHSEEISPLRLADSCLSFSELWASCEAWTKSLQSAELEVHFLPLAREFGSRLSAQTPQLASAVLLLCGRHFDYAAVVFDGLKLFGHAGECLFRQNDLGACVHSCILHSNVSLLERCAIASSHQVLIRLSDAFKRWDLNALDELICSPTLLESERDLVKMAMTVLSKTR